MARHALEHLSQPPAEKWQAFTSATESWDKTLRLCLILFVAQIPLDIAALMWVLRRVERLGRGQDQGVCLYVRDHEPELGG